MDFITTKQAAENWNITPNRVTILAKQGRIPGAFQIGTQWMIPEGTEKPIDGRTAKAKKAEQGEFFRFPLYVNFEENEYYPPLTPEEKELRNAQLDFFAGELDKAQEGLQALAKKTTNTAIQIGTLSFLYVCILLNNDGKGADDCFNLLTITFAEDIPHRAELEMFIPWINTFLGSYKSTSQGLHIEPKQDYDPSVYYFASYLSIYHLMRSSGENSSPSFLDIYELLCRRMELDGYFYEAQELHFILFFCYLYLADKENMQHHLEKGIEIAFTHNLLLPAAGYAIYYPNEFRGALMAYPTEFIKKIMDISGSIFKNFAEFSSKEDKVNIITALPQSDYVFLGYLNCGYSYKEIADLTGLSVRTVAGHCSDIYARLGIKNKQELIQMYDELMGGK